MHRRILCLDGRHSARRNARATLAHAPGSGPPGGATSAGHFASEVWDEDENRTTSGELKETT